MVATLNLFSAVLLQGGGNWDLRGLIHNMGTLALTVVVCLPVLAGCKKAFSEIETQVKKHQSRLRREHEWKRKRPIE